MKKKVIGALSVSAVVLTLCGILFCVRLNKESIRWNNETSIDESVTHLYSESFLEEFILYRLNSSPVLKLKDIQKIIDVECLRKTYQGYYAVFLSDSGKALLVFFKENGEYRWYEWEQFYSSKEDFDKTVHIGVTMCGDVICELGGVNWSSGSGIQMTVQVQEGAYSLACWWPLELGSDKESTDDKESMASIYNHRIVGRIIGYKSNEEYKAYAKRYLEGEKRNCNLEWIDKLHEKYSFNTSSGTQQSIKKLGEMRSDILC